MYASVSCLVGLRKEAASGVYKIVGLVVGYTRIYAPQASAGLAPSWVKVNRSCLVGEDSRKAFGNFLFTGALTSRNATSKVQTIS